MIRGCSCDRSFAWAEGAGKPLLVGGGPKEERRDGQKNLSPWGREHPLSSRSSGPMCGYRVGAAKCLA